MIIVTAGALMAPASASAVELEEVGTFQFPTYVTSDPGDADRLFVVERDGRIRLVEGGETTQFLDLDSIVHSEGEPDSSSEQGLLSMAFSPDYASSGLFYVAYSGIDDPSTTQNEVGDYHIDEFSANGDTADPNSRREVLTIRHRKSLNHYGGQLNFGPDGYLYASTGDGSPQGDPDGNAQNVHNRLGKILRIDPTGSRPGKYTVPPDNPFTDTAGCADGCDEIWSYGLRNPWRFSFDRETGALVIADVGQATYEEVDYEPASAGLGRGDNFGWNCREGAHDYPGPGESAPVCDADPSPIFTEPVFDYGTHVNGTCSITGGYVVRDTALDDLYGRYLYGDFCLDHLRSLSLGLPKATDDRVEDLPVTRPTSFGEDADCRIYVASLEGPVYRLVESAAGSSAGCQEPPPDAPPDNGGPDPGPPEAAHLTLELDGKRQRLKKKVKFFALADVDSTLVAEGRKLKETTKRLAANERTKVRAKLRRRARDRLARRLEKKGNGKVKVRVKAMANDHSGTTAEDKVKLKLRD